MQEKPSWMVTHREQIVYLIVGCLTTGINYAIFTLLIYSAHINYMASNVLAWIGAVAFAYYANGKWVYRSTAHRGIREAASFVLSRLFSLGLESLLLFLLVGVLAFNELVAKLLVAVVVVVVNYLTGLLVYKKK